MSIMFPQTRKFLLAPWLTFVEDDEAVIKMIIKGRSPEPTELRLIGYLTELTWTQKSKQNTLTPRTNSQTYREKAISHVMSGTSAISALPVFPK